MCRNRLCCVYIKRFHNTLNDNNTLNKYSQRAAGITSDYVYVMMILCCCSCADRRCIKTQTTTLFVLGKCRAQKPFPLGTAAATKTSGVRVCVCVCVCVGVCVCVCRCVRACVRAYLAIYTLMASTFLSREIIAWTPRFSRKKFSCALVSVSVERQ